MEHIAKGGAAPSPCAPTRFFYLVGLCLSRNGVEICVASHGVCPQPVPACVEHIAEGGAVPPPHPLVLSAWACGADHGRVAPTRFFYPVGPCLRYSGALFHSLLQQRLGPLYMERVAGGAAPSPRTRHFLSGWDAPPLQQGEFLTRFFYPVGSFLPGAPCGGKRCALPALPTCFFLSGWAMPLRPLFIWLGKASGALVATLPPLEGVVGSAVLGTCCDQATGKAALSKKGWGS